MAKTTAKHLEVPHHIYKLKTSNISDTLFQTIFHLDEPRMGYSYQNLIISKATSDHYKVVYQVLEVMKYLEDTHGDIIFYKIKK